MQDFLPFGPRVIDVLFEELSGLYLVFVDKEFARLEAEAIALEIVDSLGRKQVSESFVQNLRSRVKSLRERYPAPDPATRTPIDLHREETALASVHPAWFSSFLELAFKNRSPITNMAFFAQQKTELMDYVQKRGLPAMRRLYYFQDDLTLENYLKRLLEVEVRIEDSTMNNMLRIAQIEFMRLSLFPPSRPEALKWEQEMLDLIKKKMDAHVQDPLMQNQRMQLQRLHQGLERNYRYHASRSVLFRVKMRLLCWLESWIDRFRPQKKDASFDARC